MEEIKLSLLADDTIVYTENPKEFMHKHRYRLVGELNKNTETSQHTKIIVNIWDEQLKNKIKHQCHLQ